MEFIDLVRFEYRKMFKKKSVVFAVTLAFVIAILSTGGTLIGSSQYNGEKYESHYSEMKKDREYARELTGRELDTELILEAAAAYATIPKDAEIYQLTEEYQKNARPYFEVYGMLRPIYQEVMSRFTIEEMGNLTKEQADQFYDIVSSIRENKINSSKMSDRAKEVLLEGTKEIRTPYIYTYAEGYTRYFQILYTNIILAVFVVAIMVAPLFAGEYTSKADQIILSAKYGKSKLIKAKIFTGFSVAIGIALLFVLQTYFESMLLFGPDGRDLSSQKYILAGVYDLSFGQVALLQAIGSIFASIFVAGVTMVLSAKFKTPFGVIIFISLLLVVPMFFSITDEKIVLYNLIKLLPSNMIAIWDIVDKIQYEIVGLVIPPYVMKPIFATLVAAVLLPFTYRAFKKHQVA